LAKFRFQKSWLNLGQINPLLYTILVVLVKSWAIVFVGEKAEVVEEV